MNDINWTEKVKIEKDVTTFIKCNYAFFGVILRKGFAKFPSKPF